MNTYPSQYIPLSEKLKIKPGELIPNFIKLNYHYWNEQAVSDLQTRGTFQELEQIAKGKIITERYKYLENPFNTTDSRYTKYPAKLRNYDIITPILDRYISERLERPDTQQVYTKGEDTTNAFKEARSIFFQKVLQQQFINELNQLGLDTGIATKEVPALQDLEDEFILSFTKQQAKYGSEALDILKSQLLLKEKYQKAFYYWLVYGRVFSMTGINYDDIQYDILKATDVSVISWDENSRYAEDAQAAVVTKQWTIAGIIDNWGVKLKQRYGDKIISQLENYQQNKVTSFNPNNQIKHTNQFVYDSQGNRYGVQDNTMLEVQHIYWKSIAKRGILTYTNELGFLDTMIVSDDYVLDKTAGEISIEWIPENEVWYIIALKSSLLTNNSTLGTNANINRQTGHLGNFGDDVLYLDFGPFPVQRNLINNNSVCKLPVNGTYYGYDPYEIDSVTKKGINYQELFNIFHYRFELTLAKNKDKLMLFPLGLIPKNKGWTTDRWMHQVHAFSMAFFDETSEKASATIQAIKSIDMSLSQYMGDMWQFMQAIKKEWWDSIGMNDQRYGDIGTSAGKGTTQQAVYRSSVSTKELNFQFDCFLDQDANGLIDYSKFAWADGKKGSYLNSHGRQIFYEINGEDHAITEYGVFSSSSIEEYDNVQFLKNTVLQPLAQNGTPGSTIAKLLKTNNLAKIEELLERGELIQQQQQEAQEKQQQELQKYLADSKAQIEREENETKIKVAEISADARIEVASLTADSFNSSLGDSDNDGVSESDEIFERAYQRQLKREALEETKRANRAKEDAERHKVNTNLAIAKENKNKYDK